MSRQRSDAWKVIYPGRAWLLASVLTLAAAIGFGVMLSRTIDSVNQGKLDTATEGFEVIVRDQIAGFRTVGSVLPVALGEDVGAFSVEELDAFLGGGDLGVAMIDAFPLDGLVGLGSVTIEPSGATTPQMLPNGNGFDEAVLRDPVVISAVDDTLGTGLPAMSAPLDAPGAAYAAVSPVSSTTVIVQLIDATDLVTDAAQPRGVRVLEVAVVDGPTRRVAGDTGAVPPGESAFRQVDVALFGRPIELGVFPGAEFGWQQGWVGGAAAGAMGVAIALLIYVVGVINRRRRLEQEARVRLAEQINEDKDRFVAAVSHELRTPLTSVVGLADELSDHIDSFDREQVADLIQIMARESHEMALLVEDLLVAARADDGTVVIRPEALDIDEQIVAVCAGLGDLNTTISVLPSNATVWADPLRFRQIVRNLIMNAVRHGGPFVEVGVHHDHEVTAVEIRDDGLGVHGEHRSRMFEPYYRSAVMRGQAPSVGLGLSVAHSLARAMDGSVSYRFDEGWSVFRVELPAVMVAASAADPARR